MNNILTRGGKISVVFALIMLLVIVVAGQPGSGNIKLRNAIDYDGDGRADYPAYRESENTWYIYQSSNTVKLQAFGMANEDFPTPGDYDGDGIGDIAMWRDSTGVWYRINSSDNTFVAIQFGLTGDEPVARDYDGDGKTDLATIRRANGVMTWYILQSRTNGFYGVSWGNSLTDYAAPGDYDGDGKFDLAIQRRGATDTAQAHFWILRSRDNVVQIVPWGIANDFPVPGDYDGDGSTDVAIVREGATPDSPLVWWVLRSSDGSHTTTAFGTSGIDLLTQNDYDGDGKTDISIWRSVDATMYVLRSTDGGFYGVRWAYLPTDFPVASYDSH